LENDVLETLESGGAVFDLHAENGALPRREEEFGEIHGVAGRIDFADRLGLSNAGGKWSLPFLKDFLQSLAQEIALRGFEAKIADQTTAIPLVVCQHRTDEVKIALQTLPRSARLVLQSRFDIATEVGKVAIQYFLGKGLF